MLGKSDTKFKAVYDKLTPFNDCTVKTSDGAEFAVQKCILSEHSNVLGFASLLENVECLFNFLYDSSS